ncbi:ABC transporter ATP-binding protein [Aurantiacibacter xanthus]|uniref:ABC transporter ATP-binding protein n=1 Tax=Aurantiacibacter xanthus TaxID=1784712 RepID=A0A3A1P817_9SPHN|nr:ABC transporter ATP-binding protein [Aurantiacibacter xanthus]RIV89759.1 ABC transporter ATP-binding protein [Aurantiacibacter xanthus]
MIASLNRFVTFLWRLTNGRIGIALALNVLASFTEGVSLFLLIPLIATIDAGRSGNAIDIPVIGDLMQRFQPSLGLLLVGFVLLIAVQGTLIRSKTVYLTTVMHHAIDRLRQAFFVRAGNAQWEVLQQTRVSDLSNMLTVETGRVQIAAANLMSLLQALILLATYLVMALLVSWQMALFAAVIGLVMFAALYPIRRQATRFGQDVGQMFREQNRTLLEFLTGIRVAKSFLIEDAYAKRFWQRLTLIRRSTLRYTRISTLGTFSFQVMSAIAAAAFIWVAVEVAQLDFGRLIVLLLIFLRLAPRFGAIQESIQNLLSNLPAFDSFREQTTMFAEAAEPKGKRSEAAPPFTDEVRLEGLSLSYPGAAKPALDDVSLSIKFGRITALIGPSGSGKSTIADLVMGLLRPTTGRITVDGVEITDRNRRAWRGSVAFVPQEAFLLHDTIAANLRIALPDASDDLLWSVLDQAKALPFVEQLSDGLQTVVGERGTRLSGGERQRIALARALLRKPKLLILDEATSALDWENQQMIAADIAAMRGKVTILTVAHRPSMIRFADDMIAIENGRCVESGTFAALAADPNSRLAAMLRGEGTEV